VSESPPYRLIRRPPPVVEPPVLDGAQRAVARHRGGPLLVLAGPGTGKTTTIVESVVARVEEGLDPEQVLVLTFSRRAAAELRERIGLRLGRSVAAPGAWTFHSFCYALVRECQPEQEFADPLRLLSAPEQDVMLRELVAGSVADGLIDWPAGLRPALPTRGFAEELRALAGRARSLGLGPHELAEAGLHSGRDDWRAAATLLEGYLDVLDARGAIDYAELVRRAVALADRSEVRASLAGRFAAVYVDEYQDVDPGQADLLDALAGGGRDLVVVGDPDQSIYAFRGADVGQLLGFRERFRTRSGDPAPVVALRHSRRCGPELLAASRNVACRLPLVGLPGDIAREHRELSAAASIAEATVGRFSLERAARRDGSPVSAGGASTAASQSGANPRSGVCAGERHAPGGRAVVPAVADRAEVRLYPSAAAQAESIADLLRRAHLDDGVPWSRMAVLVRSAVRSIPALRRVLGSAGVPVEVAGDELPLAEEPAIAPLLVALRCAADPDRELTAERARMLLCSPLGGADAADLRRLGHALRGLDRQGCERGADGRRPRSSDELLREAVAEPAGLLDVDPALAGPARRLGRLLAAVTAVLRDDGTPDEALWALWSGSSWPRRLAEASYAGGPGGRAADRDLDAVVALFQTAAREEERGRRRPRGRAGVANLLAELEAQQIPADPIAERPVRGDAVRLLTAHRSKGLEWDLVVVAGVQEGSWPDLRARGSLLQAERLGPAGLVSPPGPATLLAEERRLFYVAATRARHRLVVTAVDSPAEHGERPSRFLAELGVPAREVGELPRRPLAPAGLVAALRSAAVDPAASPALRRAAAGRLGRLAAARDAAGSPLVPAADPQSWWGLAEITAASTPVVPVDAPVRLSGSSLEGIERCALRWFLSHEAHADQPRTVKIGFGSILHVLAAEIADGSTPAEIGALLDRLDTVWHQLGFDAPWQSAQERTAAEQALAGLLRWLADDRGRSLVGAERGFEVPVDTQPRPAVLRGAMDRVERDADGRMHVVDFKTSSTVPSKADAAGNAQLAAYQLAVALGAVEPDVAAGGAELVYLREQLAGGMPKIRSQPALADAQAAVDRLSAAVGTMLTETFAPTPGDHCRICPYTTSCPAHDDGRQVVT
jgi:superfamily I DNA/RNA helicase/RecB family exonuclease